MNLFLPMLGVGIVTSVHCVAMCGSMVLTYAVKGDQGGPLLKRMFPHLAYHSAKLTSYVAVGLLLGAIGSAFNLGGVRGWVTVFAGAFMVLLGLQMTGKVPALRRLSLQPPKILMKALQRTRRKANESAAAGKASLATPITFGLLTGLMPCGPLQAAQLAAAATGSPVNGAIAMLGFGLGTMPLMLAFGAVSGMLGAKFKNRMMVVAAVFVMVLGLVMLDRGAMLVGSPVTFQSIRQAVAGSPAASDGGFKAATDGVVEVPLVIENTQFVPQAVSIPADRPVRLVVDRREASSCSAQLAVPQLGVLVNLKANGTTSVDLPAAKAGSYTLTCGMGMMAGTLSVGGGSGPLAGLLSNPAALPVGALVFALGGWWLYRRRNAGHSAEPARKDDAARRPGKKASPGRKGTPAHKRTSAHEPATEPAGAARGSVLGFKPAELFIATAVVVAAVLMGLGLGGYFN